MANAQEMSSISVLSIRMVAVFLWLATSELIMAAMGSMHQPWQGEAPPIFFARAQSLQVVATAW